jgi:hypothetical protein
MSGWDPRRLIETLSFFDVIPIVSQVQQMFFGAQTPPPPEIRSGVIFDFAQAEAAAIWGVVDDVVMGGVSSSGMSWQGTVAVFSGRVSTENSGGFASVRTRNFSAPLDLSAYQGLELRLKGDGLRYKLLLRDGEGWDSLAYAFSFDTTRGQWMTVRVPFEQMVGVVRARSVAGARLDSKKVRSVQLMVSKFEYDGVLNPRFEAGEFRLEVGTIGVYSSKSPQ